MTSPHLIERIITIVTREPGLYLVSGPWTPLVLAISKAILTAAHGEMLRQRHAAVMEVARAVGRLGNIGVGM